MRRWRNLIVPKLREAFDRFAIVGDVNELWMKGGRGSTKSTVAAYMILFGVMTHKDCCALVLRRVDNTVRNSCYNQVVDCIHHMAEQFVGIVRVEDFDFKTSPLQITHIPSGNSILFSGLDNEKKKKSIKAPGGKYFGYLWFEELDEFESYEKVTSTKVSVLRGKAPVHATVMTYNPPMTNVSWVNMESQTPRKGRMVVHCNYLDVLPYHPDWMSGILEEAEACRARDERHYRWEYLGEVTGTGGTVFQNLTIREITDEEIATFENPHFGLDWGFSNAFAWSCTEFDAHRRRALIWDEIYGHRMLTSEQAAAIKSKELFNQPIYADCASPEQIATFNDEYHIFTLPCYKGGGDSRRHGYRCLQSLAEIVIDPVRCPNIAREFQLMEFERDRVTGEFIEDYPKVNDHGIDSVRYALVREFQQRGLF